MSLDVYLYSKRPADEVIIPDVSICQNGAKTQLTLAELRQAFPGCEIECADEDECVFDANITHNLGYMAEEAGVYMCCWRPDEIGAKQAKDIVPALEAGFKLLTDFPSRFTKFNPENGWGSYVNLVDFVSSYLSACKSCPEAIIEVSR